MNPQHVEDGRCNNDHEERPLTMMISIGRCPHDGNLKSFVDFGGFPPSILPPPPFLNGKHTVANRKPLSLPLLTWALWVIKSFHGSFNRMSVLPFSFRTWHMWYFKVPSSKNFRLTLMGIQFSVVIDLNTRVDKAEKWGKL